MGEKLAKFISVLFHPLLIPTFMLAGVMYYFPALLNFDFSNSVRLLALVFITTFLIPIVGIAILKFTNNITGFEMQHRKERITPFVFTSLFYIVTTYLFYDRYNFPIEVLAIFGGITLSVVVVTVITLFWKVSAHSMGISGALGGFLALVLNNPDTSLWIPMTFCFWACGLIATARLQLKAHTPSQVWVGLLAGFIITFISVFALT